MSDLGVSPYNYMKVYAKSDTVACPKDPNGNPAQAVYNDGAGNITVANVDGSTTLLTAVTLGVVAISPYRIDSTNTTAGPFVLLYRT